MEESKKLKGIFVYLEENLVREAKVILAQQDEEREKNNQPRNRSGLLNNLLSKWIKEQKKKL